MEYCIRVSPSGVIQRVKHHISTYSMSKPGGQNEWEKKKHNKKKHTLRSKLRGQNKNVQTVWVSEAQMEINENIDCIVSIKSREVAFSIKRELHVYSWFIYFRTENCNRIYYRTYMYSWLHLSLKYGFRYLTLNNILY